MAVVCAGVVLGGVECAGGQSPAAGWVPGLAREVYFTC